MTINKDKTKVIVFGSNKRSKYAFKLGNTILETVDQYKYLGTIFSPSGSFLNARKHIACQANKAMHLLYMRIFNLNLPLDLQLKLFDHTILPIITYSCEVWGYENIDILEKIHTNFLRKITKSRNSTPLYMLYAELGRLPIEIIIKTRMIKYWNTILLSNDFKISHICYKFMLHSEYQCKWITFIKNIFHETGMTDIWLNQNNIQNNQICKLIKQNLTDQFLQSWSGQLQLSSKGKNYNLFKDNINFEVYIKMLPKHKYLPILKFRLANHRFAVERGRWKNSQVPHSERKCTKCNLNDIGDEFHYLLVCPFFKHKRIQLLPSYYYTNPNVLKFKDLLCTTSVTVLENLSSFIKILLNNVQ